jgi:hypothetical protein
MRFVSSVLVGLAVAGSARVEARAQPRALSADDVLLMRKLQSPLDAFAWNFVELQNRQRRGPAARLIVPPLETGPGRKWLPSGPVGLPPPGMAVGPTPFLPISAAPVITETVNTILASGRGNEAMLEALTIGFGWRIP